MNDCHAGQCQEERVTVRSARATLPIPAPAPLRLSMVIGVCSTFCIEGASRRAIVSANPPGAEGTIIVMLREGNDSAPASDTGRATSIIVAHTKNAFSACSSPNRMPEIAPHSAIYLISSAANNRAH